MEIKSTSPKIIPVIKTTLSPNQSSIVSTESDRVRKVESTSFRNHGKDLTQKYSQMKSQKNSGSRLSRHKGHTVGKLFPCSKCGKTFCRKIALLYHSRIHTGEKLFSCSQCEKRFVWKSGLLHHERIHTGERPFSCEKCFRQKRDVLRHERIHTGERPFDCSDCGRSFRTRQNRWKHRMLHTDKKLFVCNHCGKGFIRKSRLLLHERIHNGERPFACSVCGKSFKSKDGLSKHKKLHTDEKPFVCNHCGKGFIRKSRLLDHERIHTGERPFACSDCGESFRSTNILLKHKKLHNDERGFIQKSLLLDHEMRHADEKPFSCSQCGKGFLFKFYLLTHTKVHTGQEKFSCIDCRQQFSQECEFLLHRNSVLLGISPHCDSVEHSSQNDHEMSHADEKPYFCSQCGKGFLSKRNLSKHMSVRTGQEKFSCIDCRQQFSQECEFMLHRKSVLLGISPHCDSVEHSNQNDNLSQQQNILGSEGISHLEGSLSSDAPQGEKNESKTILNYGIGTEKESLEDLRVKLEFDPYTVFVKEKNEPLVAIIKEENDPSEDMFQEENKPLVDIIKEENNHSEDVIQEENEPLADMIHEENEPLADMIQEENEPLADMIQEENEPLADMIQEENEPLADMIQEENEPLADMIHEENEPFVDIIKEENDPLEDMIQGENNPSEDIIKEENKPLVDMIKREKDPLENVIQEENNPSEDMIQEEIDFLEDMFRERINQSEDIVSNGGSSYESDEEGPPPQPPRVAEVFAWSNGSDFTTRDSDFGLTNSGIQPDFPVVGDDAQEIEYFEAFFDQGLMAFMCKQTNLFRKYSEELREATFPTPSTSRGKKQSSKDVDVKELYVFLALLMLMAHVKKPVLCEYWSSSDDITHTAVFSKYMSHDRFEDILRYLHFTDTRVVDDEDAPVLNRLNKIRRFFSRILDKFRGYFFPFQKLHVDESLVLFRGRVVLRQYIPSERHRFRLKFFVLCDCETGYVLDMIMYPASEIYFLQDDFSRVVVKRLMDKYLKENHILYMDNYYTSPSLTKFLLENDTGNCCTEHTTMKYWPKFAKLASSSMLAISWQDRRSVSMLSTANEGQMMASGKKDRKRKQPIKKLDEVRMGLLDRCDTKVSGIECVIKRIRWYKKLFMHLLDVTVLNAYKLWLVKSRNHTSLRMFQKKIISQILTKYGTVQGLTPEQHSTGGMLDRLEAAPFISRHHLGDLPPTQNRKKGQKKCFVCANTKRRNPKRKEVSQQCLECKVALCTPCFIEFHTMEHY